MPKREKKEEDPQEGVSSSKIVLEAPYARRLSITDLMNGVTPEQHGDVRPFVLWNLLIFLLSSTKDRYDARARIFFKRIAVDHLHYGTWVDVVEDIERPLTDPPVEDDGNDDHSSRSRSASPLPDNASVDSAQAVDSITPLNESKIPKRRRALSAVKPALAILEKKKGAMMLSTEARTKREKQEKTKRALMMAAAAVGGGVIIGVSAGLAAPMLTAGIGATLAALKIAGSSAVISGVGSTALITSGGILTGTSMGAKKMAKRTRGVEVFRFVPLHGGKDHNNVIISISGWVATKDSKSNVPGAKNADGKSGRPSSSSGATGSPAKPDKSNDDRKSVSSQAEDASVSAGETNEEHDPDEVLATGLDDIIVPFMGVSPVMGSQYALCFDPHILCTLGDALKMFASEIISFSATQILQQTILATMLSALNWPMWLLKLGYLVDNPWGMGLDRARKAGLLLADALCNDVQCGRPVTLVGFSLGARVIWYCLVELANRGKYGLVEDVYLFGAPLLMPRVITAVPTGDTSGRSSTPEVVGMSPKAMKSLDEWRQAVSVVSGKLYNCFSRSDWVLGFLFRASVAGLYDVAGLGPVILDEEQTPDIIKIPLDEMAPSDANASADAPEPAYKTLSAEDEEKRRSEKPGAVQNVDITELVQGHVYYRNAMPTLIKRVCNFSCWTDSIEAIEEVVGGEWLEDIDGWWQTEQDRLKNKKKRARKRTTSGSSFSSIPKPPSPLPVISKLINPRSSSSSQDQPESK